MAEAAVLKLIQQHNKPFGVQGLVDNLQSAGIKKTAVQKACDALVDAGQIVCKVRAHACYLHIPRNLPTTSCRTPCGHIGKATCEQALGPAV